MRKKGEHNFSASGGVPRCVTCGADEDSAFVGGEPCTFAPEKKSQLNRSMSIVAKCSDMFSATLYEPGEPVKEYNGYVPKWFPNPGEEHFGDYVQLDIDIDTGKIINWKKPTSAQLNETFKS